MHSELEYRHHHRASGATAQGDQFHTRSRASHGAEISALRQVSQLERSGHRHTTEERARRPRSLSPITRAGKRTLDLIASTVLLIALAPLLLALALVIWVTSPGPALYSQVRLGRDRRPFRCWKFRTMHRDADSRLASLLELDPALEAEFSATKKLRKDPRITRLGRLLRRTSLDELPQLWNVLRGDMSLVGPRPIVDDETTLYGHALPTVLSIRPGMTGLWQVSGRCDVSYDERVTMDTRYSLTHTIRGDLILLAKTLRVVITGYGAY